MGMVADMEEKKNKLDVKSRLKTGQKTLEIISSK